MKLETFDNTPEISLKMDELDRSLIIQNTRNLFMQFIFNETHNHNGLERILELKYILSRLYLQMNSAYLNSKLTSKNTIKDLLENIPLEIDLDIISDFLNDMYKEVKMNSESDLIYKLINIVKNSLDRGGFIDVGMSFFANFFDFNIIKHTLNNNNSETNYKIRLVLKDFLTTSHTLEEADTIINNKIHPIKYIGPICGGGILSFSDMFYSNSSKIYSVLNYLNEQLFLYKEILENQKPGNDGYINTINIPIHTIPTHVRLCFDVLLTSRVVNLLNMLLGPNLDTQIDIYHFRNVVDDFHNQFDKYYIIKHIKNMFKEYECKITINMDYDSKNYLYSIDVYDKKIIENNKPKK